MEKRSHLGICTEPTIILGGVKLIPDPSPQEQQEQKKAAKGKKEMQK